MALNRRAREAMRALCGEIHEDDGIDPREFFKTEQFRRKDNHKAKQLCRQVAVALDLVLSGELSDDALCGLRVATVVPAPDTSRLLVSVVADCPPEDFDPAQIEARLAACSGRLRSIVAAAITRRKTPVLSFHVLGPDMTGELNAKEGKR